MQPAPLAQVRGIQQLCIPCNSQGLEARERAQRRAQSIYVAHTPPHLDRTGEGYEGIPYLKSPSPSECAKKQQLAQWVHVLHNLQLRCPTETAESACQCESSPMVMTFPEESEGLVSSAWANEPILEISHPAGLSPLFEEAYQNESSKWPPDLSDTTSPHKLEQFITSAHALVRRFLPQDVIRRLESFIYDPLQPPAMVIRGLPIDQNLPPTSPTGLQTKLESGNYRSEVWLLGIARIVGQPFTLECLAPSKLGLSRLIKDLYPVPVPEQQVPAAAASQETSIRGIHLDFHVDFYQLDPRCFPNVHVYLGLRGDPANEGRTLVCDFRELYSKLEPSDRAVLRRQRLTWEVGVPPESFTFSKCVIEGSDETPVFNIFDESAVRAAGLNVVLKGSVGALPAYRRVKEAALQIGLTREGVRLDSGDVLLINQRRAAYARSSFLPTYDGTDRWLERVYVNAGAIWKPGGLVPWPVRCLPAEAHSSHQP